MLSSPSVSVAVTDAMFSSVHSPGKVNTTTGRIVVVGVVVADVVAEVVAVDVTVVVVVGVDVGVVDVVTVVVGLVVPVAVPVDNRRQHVHNCTTLKTRVTLDVSGAAGAIA